MKDRTQLTGVETRHPKHLYALGLHTHTCMHAGRQAGRHRCMHRCMDACMQRGMHRCIHTCTSLSLSLYMYMIICIYIYTYMYTLHFSFDMDFHASLGSLVYFGWNVQAPHPGLGFRGFRGLGLRIYEEAPFYNNGGIGSYPKP